MNTPGKQQEDRSTGSATHTHIFMTIPVGVAVLLAESSDDRLSPSDPTTTRNGLKQLNSTPLIWKHYKNNYKR